MYFVITSLGICLGSFVNALVWRVWQQEKIVSRKAKGKNRADEYSVLRGRSMCPNCKHQLAAIDLIPVLSWVTLRGKCRYCKKSISWQYPAVEIIAGVLFATSFIWWPWEIRGTVEVMQFIVWLVVVTVGLALAVYDLKWMLLPNKLVYALGIFSSLFAAFGIIGIGDASLIIDSILGSLVFGGFFYVLYQISSGKWIGGGDVRLGFALGLLLGWQKSLLCLALASYLATIIVIILVLLRKYRKKMRIPFGPFLLAGAFIAMLFGQNIIDIYLRFSGLR